ncbi:MAG: hypothetical protein LQ340_003482 [Diploschistes diacapsis]|nr:MAG: hypothetical protein LQ340_003482 [Diploschistes diacapsis]
MVHLLTRTDTTESGAEEAPVVGGAIETCPDSWFLSVPLIINGALIDQSSFRRCLEDTQGARCKVRSPSADVEDEVHGRLEGNVGSIQAFNHGLRS